MGRGGGGTHVTMTGALITVKNGPSRMDELDVADEEGVRDEDGEELQLPDASLTALM